MTRRRAELRRTKAGADDGVAVVEMAIMLALLLLLAVGALPVFSLLLGHVDLGRATAEGLRFATKVEANPCTAGTDGCTFEEATSACSYDLRRRPSANEVEAYLRAATGNDALVVSVHAPGDPATTRQPCNSSPGTPIAVTAAYDHDLGIFGSLANAASSLGGNGPMFTDNTLNVRSTAIGTEE